MYSFRQSSASIWKLYKRGRTCMPSLLNSSFHHLCLPTMKPMHKMDVDQLMNRSSHIRIKFLPCYSRTSCAGLLWYSAEYGPTFYNSYRKRVQRRLKLANKPKLDEARFNKAVSSLPARFTAADFRDVLSQEDDPDVCLELYNWASRQRRFEHDASTVHETVQKLGMAEMFEEMFVIVDQILALPDFGSEAMYNRIIYYYIRAGNLNRAVTVFRHMRKVENSACRPSIRTYNLLFGAFLNHGRQTYINHTYMDTMEALFRQMIQAGIKPNTITLNYMIGGYVLSHHVDDALCIFHQMGAGYASLPDSFTYDHVIFGLCALSRTKDASELFNQMKGKGFAASAKTYNALVNAFAIAGEVDEALKYFWEMTEGEHPADFITYKTLLDEFCRQGRADEALNLVNELNEKCLVDEPTYKELLVILEGGSRATRNYSLAATIRGTRKLRNG